MDDIPGPGLTPCPCGALVLSRVWVAYHKDPQTKAVILAHWRGLAQAVSPVLGTPHTCREVDHGRSR